MDPTRWSAVHAMMRESFFLENSNKWQLGDVRKKERDYITKYSHFFGSDHATRNDYLLSKSSCPDT